MRCKKNIIKSFTGFHTTVLGSVSMGGGVMTPCTHWGDGGITYSSATQTIEQTKYLNYIILQ